MSTVRPTKKQRALLDYIEQFIEEHGYSPSYREIMNGCQYNSIATVAVHINNLIARGHLRKRDHSARSLELTHLADETPGNASGGHGEAWLTSKIDAMIAQAEQAAGMPAEMVSRLQVLVASLEILGLEAAAVEFEPRLQTLQERVQTDEKSV